MPITLQTKSSEAIFANVVGPAKCGCAEAGGCRDGRLVGTVSARGRLSIGKVGSTCQRVTVDYMNSELGCGFLLRVSEDLASALS